MRDSYFFGNKTDGADYVDCEERPFIGLDPQIVRIIKLRERLDVIDRHAERHWKELEEKIGIADLMSRRPRKLEAVR